MKTAAALFSAALMVGAAHAAGETTSLSPPQKVTSKDGGLTVSVPRGALKKNVKVRIRVLTPAQYPPELKGATFRPGSRLYALEPSGLKFSKPATITRRIDTKVGGFDPADGRPVIVLTTRSAGGKWEILKGHRARADGDLLVITATTRHFSTVVSLDGSLRVSLVPPSIETGVGQVFGAETRVTSTQGGSAVKETSYWQDGTGVVKLLTPYFGTTSQYQCTRQGTGTYGVSVHLSEVDLVVALFSLANRDYEYTLDLRGTARCRGLTPLQLAAACVVVAHSPLGSYPSFTRWLLQFATANLPASAQASLTASGVNNGQAMSQPINSTTGKVELVGGISSFGAKNVQKLEVGGQDLTQQLIAKVGAAPTVTAAQGTIAGQCPP